MTRTCVEERASGDAAHALNRACLCRTLDKGALSAALEQELGDDGLLRERPNLFSNVAVFVSAQELETMSKVVAAIEGLARRPAYIATALDWAPVIARHDYGPRGVLMGYDFHLTPDGPALIEVNTNAGGAFLNAALTRAQSACCAEAQTAAAPAEQFEDAFFAMIEADWRAQGRAGAPASIAIVDDDPRAQFLYPEFLLAARVLERRGFSGVIADARDLRFASGSLSIDGKTIDLVYNRLVDFSLAAPAHAALRAAYEAGATVVTPNPRIHAIFADKRNLTLMSDPALLRSWDVSEADIAALRAIPTTRRVTDDNAPLLWGERKQWFFKPAQGYGSKAAYRGDKLTQRVWGDIVAHDYVAQVYAPPGARAIMFDGVRQDRKVDVRLYTYDGKLALTAARLYQGQTTNFRTPGGGFAPLFMT
ncbi:MAG TPA: hypothetical protein VG735_15175 [Caulobacterales bacterium]|nr:hypothetical protein [Caulobacterales bacterium]